MTYILKLFSFFFWLTRNQTQKRQPRNAVAKISYYYCIVPYVNCVLSVGLMTNSKVLNGVSVSNAHLKSVGFQSPNLGTLQKKWILFTPLVLIITHFNVIKYEVPLIAVFSIINSSPNLAFLKIAQCVGSNSPIFAEVNGSGLTASSILLGGDSPPVALNLGPILFLSKGLLPW